MLNIAICEDKAEDMMRLRRMLLDTRLSYNAAEYTDAETLIDDMENRRKQFDIFLLDIYLTGQSGVEAARRIRAFQDNAVLIFLSVSEDFYREAFDLYAFHYLIKPIKQAELCEVLKKAADILDKRIEETLLISFRGQNIILLYSDILYISSSNHILCAHTRGGQEYSFYGKLDDIEKKLKTNLSVRCHKSFIVNLSYVTKMTREGFYIGDTLISISRSYASIVKECYDKQLFGLFQDN